MEAVEKLAEDQGGGELPKHSLDRVIDQPMLAVIFIERMHCLSLRKRHKSPDTATNSPVAEGGLRLPACQCPGELAHGLLVLLVADFGKVAGNLELHPLA